MIPITLVIRLMMNQKMTFHFKYSLIKNDVAGSLEIKNEYRNITGDDLWRHIADNQEIIDHINPLTAVTRFNEFFRLSDILFIF